MDGWMDGWSGRNRFFGKAGEEHELLELDPWRRPAGRRDYCGSQYVSLPQERWPVRPSVRPSEKKAIYLSIH